MCYSGKKMSLSFRKSVKHLRWSGAVEQACWARFSIKKRVDVMVHGCFEYVKLQSPLMIDGSEFCNNALQSLYGLLSTYCYSTT
jgi:hypothetical protein